MIIILGEKNKNENVIIQPPLLLIPHHHFEANKVFGMLTLTWSHESIGVKLINQYFARCTKANIVETGSKLSLQD